MSFASSYASIMIMQGKLELVPSLNFYAIGQIPPGTAGDYSKVATY